MHPDILRPGTEGHVAEEAFQGHEQGKVVQPPEVAVTEIPVGIVFADVAAPIGFAQQFKPVFIQLVIVYFGTVYAKVQFIAFRSGQDTLLNQAVQADEIGVSRKGGKGLVGGIIGIPVGGDAQRQDLPVALTGFLQPVHKTVGFFVKAADAVFGRQTGDGH